MTTTTQPSATMAPSPAPSPAPIVKRQWGAEFVQRLLGPSSTAVESKPATEGTITYGQAAKRAVGDATTVGITASLLGAANAKGWLDHGRIAFDGILALFGMATSVAAAVRFPTVSRVANNIGLTGLATLSFRKSEELMGGGQRTTTPQPTTTPPAHAGEVDHIQAVAEKLDLL